MSNLELFQESAKKLKLSAEERRVFASSFIGALSERVSPVDWFKALRVAELIALGDRARGSIDSLDYEEVT